MKLTITHSNARKAFAPAAGVAPNRATLATLSHVRLSADEKGVTVAGTDLDFGVVVRADADVVETGGVLLPAKKAMEIFNSLQGQPISISSEGDHVEIRSGKYRSVLNSLPLDEFPAIPSFDFEKAGRFPAALLQDMVLRTSWAVSTEETRPILQGVLWQLGSEEMKMVATDGHRMAVYSVPLEGEHEALKGDLILPPKALSLVRNIVDPNREIEVARQENYVGFRQGDIQIYCRLIDGPYPNYKQVIKEDQDKFAIADITALSDVVKRALITASEQTHRIRFSLNAVSRFSVDTPELGKSSEEFEMQYDGDPLEIGFNGKYFVEALRYIPGNRARLAFRAPERAGIFYPAPSEGERLPDFKILLMPLRLLD